MLLIDESFFFFFYYFKKCIFILLLVKKKFHFVILYFSILLIWLVGRRSSRLLVYANEIWLIIHLFFFCFFLKIYLRPTTREPLHVFFCLFKLKKDCPFYIQEPLMMTTALSLSLSSVFIHNIIIHLFRWGNETSLQW